MPRARTVDPPLTPLELQIMQVLWETGPATVQTVQTRLEGRALAYTTVQTMLNVLHRKGKVGRKLKDRAYLYRPILSRHKATGNAVSEVLDRFFGGSADSLVLNLLETRKLTPEKLARLQEMLERRNQEEESHGNKR